jgi:hypothetical protein
MPAAAMVSLSMRFSVFAARGVAALRRRRKAGPRRAGAIA